ncbi:hypothetical protein HJG60_012094 [Phyllostomus discolor]|uniref:Uncharacterized protein n=1 Tax=Phyllostomus discolor TaxID=89673 RepID=A0A833ZDS8_9CHIR|nr:hypothetical protein HJG60_012094 [Phyllostomus discolor]
MKRFVGSRKRPGTEKCVSVSCRFFLCFHHPDFLPKGLSSRTFKRVFGVQPALLGCFVFPHSLPLFFLGLLPPLGRREQPPREGCQERGAFQGLPGPSAWRRFIGRFPGFSLFRRRLEGEGCSKFQNLKRLFLRRCS